MHVRSSCSGVTMGNTLKVSAQMQPGNLCTFMQIAYETKLGGVVDRPDVCAAVQRHADKLEKWTDKNVLKKCQILHLGRNKPSHQDKLGPDQLESHLAERDLGILIVNKLHMGQQCALLAEKDQHWLLLVKCCGKVERCDPSSLLSTAEMHLGHCPLVLGSPVQEQHDNTGISPAKGHKGHQSFPPMKTG